MPFPVIVSALRRRWWLLLAGPLLAATVALGLSLWVLPARWDATAGLVMNRSIPSISLDPRVQTVSDADIVRQASVDDRGRRETLLALVVSDQVIADLLAQAGPDLPGGPADVTLLRDRLMPDAAANVLNLTARGDTPQQAARLANLWGQIVETYVNDIYSRTADTPEKARAQAAAAQTGYLAAEQTLVGFLKDNQINELQRRLDQKQAVLKTMQDQQVQTLELKLRARMDALNKIDMLLANANALRERLGSAGTAAGSAGALADLLVQVSSLTTGADLPVELQIPLDRLSGQSASQRASDLASMTDALVTLRTAWQTEVDTLHQTVLRAPDLLGSQVAGQDLLPDVQAMQDEINGLQSQLEAQSDTKRRLTDERDVAWESYTALTRRAAEVAIAADTTTTEVRFISRALAPDEKATPHTLLNLAAALVLGAIVALGFILLEAYAAFAARPPA